MNQPMTNGPLVRSRNIANILLVVGFFMPLAAALAGIGEYAQAGHFMAKTSLIVLLVFLCLAAFFRHRSDTFKASSRVYIALYVVARAIMHVATSSSGDSETGECGAFLRGNREAGATHIARGDAVREKFSAQDIDLMLERECRHQG